jgi:IS5 family transposase
VGLSIVLRTYFAQHSFSLSDPGVEELLYESWTVRRFVGVDLGIAPTPDETTVLRFRHMLEQHNLGGLIVEATILNAPSSIREQHGRTRPEMKQTMKGPSITSG